VFDAAEVMNSPALKASLGKAQELIGDRQELAGLVQDANAKLDRIAASSGPVGDAVRAGRAGYAKANHPGPDSWFVHRALRSVIACPKLLQPDTL